MIQSVDRVFGAYPMSMATSLAIEGATHTGEYEDLKAKDFPLRNKLLMVNLRTLFRNAHNAFSTEHQSKLTLKPLLDSIREDMETIVMTLRQHEPDCEVKFYYCTYKGINKEFPEVKFYSPNTPKQKAYAALEQDLFKNLDHLQPENDEWEIIEFKRAIATSSPTVLLTHHPLDLLNEDTMPSLALLESHTGKVKGKSEWSSKLTNKPENIPFSAMTLCLFGDGVVFAPQPIAFRKKLLELGKKAKWNYKTRDAQIIEAVKRSYEPHLVKLLRKLKK